MEGIFFARFDDEAGPVLVMHVDYEDNYERCQEFSSIFEHVTDYIITRKELCGSILTVTDSNKKIQSCPLYVENSNFYKRNSFFFAFGFVFEQHFEAGPYSATLRKICAEMRTLEVEAQLLSGSVDDVTEKLRPTLCRVLHDLRKWRQCVVTIGESNSLLALKVVPRLIDPPEVFDHHVPVRVRSIDALVTKEWDVTIKRVLDFIDGERHIKLIAEESGVASSLVRKCVRQLLYFRCVRLVDIFQYSNLYACTPRIVELAKNQKLAKACIKYISHGDTLPSLQYVFHLYSSLQPSVPLKVFCLVNDTFTNHVDDRKLVLFGILHGFIKRIHKFPIYAKPVLPNMTFQQYKDEHKDAKVLPEYTQGHHSFDAICAQLWIPEQQVASTVDMAALDIVQK